MRVKKLTAILLSLLTAFSVAACSKGSGSGDASNSNGTTSGSGSGSTGNVKNPTTVYTEDSSIPYTEGLHIINVSETSHKIVNNGVSTYKIVIPENATEFEQRAASEFRSYFRNATGCMLPLIKDNEAAYDANSEYIVLGNVSFAAQANHGFNTTGMKTGGYVIKTTGKSVFGLGTNDIGTLHGAYELLAQLINWVPFSKDLVVYDKDLKNLTLKDFSICEEPDIEFNHSGYVDYGSSSLTSHRFRMYTEREIWMDGLNGHAIFNIMKPDQYKADHPKWYSDCTFQLCYTARGDKEEYDKMLETMVENVKIAISQNRDRKNISIAQNDFGTWCECSACKAVAAEYGGANAATQLLFANQVAEEIETWLQSDEAGEDKGRDINLAIFAYQQTVDAPVKTNDDGSYSMINGLKAHDLLSIWFAPIYAFFTYGPTAVENKSTLDNFEKWSLLTDSFYLWYYDVNVVEYMLPYNSFGPTKDWYAIAKKYNATYLFNQGAWNAGSMSGFKYLKRWLNYKLGWNVSLNYQELLDEFFDGYFGPASATMRQYFNEVEAHLSQYNTQMGDIFSKVLTDKYWEQEKMRHWLKLTEKALEEIKPIANQDPQLYENYYNNINKESMFPRYVLTELYRGSFEKAEMISFVSAFANDIDKYSMAQSEATNGGIYSGKIRAYID